MISPDQTTIYIFMDLVTGGELFDHIVDNGVGGPFDMLCAYTGKAKDRAKQRIPSTNHKAHNTQHNTRTIYTLTYTHRRAHTHKHIHCTCVDRERERETHTHTHTNTERETEKERAREIDR